MFIRYYLELPVAPAVVERGLTDDPRRWLPGLADEASRRGDRLLAEVGFGEQPRLTRRVTVEVGSPARLGTTTVVPITWTPVHTAGLLPSLDADLEIAPLGAARTQVAISARYEPPFGLVGRAIDRSILHRVAEATVKDFLDRVGAALLERSARPAVAGSMPA